MSRADKFFSDAPSPDDAPPRKNANKMSTEVDAREAWVNAGAALLWSMAAVYSNPSSSIEERAESISCVERHLRTTPEGSPQQKLDALCRALKTHDGDRDGWQFGLGRVRWLGAKCEFLWASQVDIDEAIQESMITAAQEGK